MTDTGAHDGCDAAAALPDAEGKLDILATPDFEAFVKLANVLEVGFVDSDSAADEGGGEEGLACLLGTFSFVFLNLDPTIAVDEKCRT